MIVDTSAWVEFLRGTGSPAHRALRERIVAREPVLVPELVMMELLAGAGDEASARQLRRLLYSFDVVPLAPLVDTQQAAAMQRRCRAGGRTVRSMIDCLIAAMALRLGEPVLHQDRDFDVLAQETGLVVHSA